MTETTFQIGDTVRLKSGGPLMTYEGAGGLSGVICSWFDGGKLNRQGFTLATLERARPPR